MTFPSNQRYIIRNPEIYQQCQDRGTEAFPYFGVKGYSPLIDIIMLPDQLPIEYMHLICLGVFKTISKRLFSPKFSRLSCFIGNF